MIGRWVCSPHTTVYITHPGTGFPCSISPPLGRVPPVPKKKVGVANVSAERFRTTYRSLLAPSLVVEQWCVENRPPVGCDIHRRTWYYSLSFQATAFRAGRINLLIRDKRVIRSRPFTPAESTYKSMSLAWHSILLIAPSSDHCHTQVWARQQLPRTRSSGTYQKMDSHPVPSRGI